MNMGLQKQRKQNYDAASLLEREKTFEYWFFVWYTAFKLTSDFD
jgi:hypothetical protein